MRETKADRGDRSIRFSSLFNRFDAVEFAALVQLWCAILLCSGFVLALTSSNTSDLAFEDRDAGTPLLQFITFAAYGPALLFILARPGDFMRTVTRGWACSLLLLIALASVMWSVDPFVSIRRSIALVIAMLFVIHAASWFTPQRFIRQLAFALGVLLVLSLIAAAVPGYGIHPNGPHIGKWRGVFMSKNTLGLVCGVACFTFVAMLAMTPKPSRERWLWWGLLLLGGILILLANARTSLIGFIAALAAIAAAKMLYLPTGWQKKMAMSLRVAVVSAATIFVVVIQPVAAAVILNILGRDMTLSGRTNLWAYAIHKGLDRPWLGAGFKTFWVDALTLDLRVLHEHWAIEGETQAMTANAHDGYLDAWLELGVPGLVLILIMFWVVARRANIALARTRDPLFLWYVGAITFVAFYYLTNSYIMKHNELSWFIAAYSFYTMSALRFPPSRAVGSVPGRTALSGNRWSTISATGR